MLIATSLIVLWPVLGAGQQGGRGAPEPPRPDNP
jgi:hypothetical protein